MLRGATEGEREEREEGQTGRERGGRHGEGWRWRERKRQIGRMKKETTETATDSKC